MCLCLKQVLIFSRMYSGKHIQPGPEKKKTTCVRDPYQQLSGKTTSREEKVSEARRAQRAQIRLTQED